MDGDANAIQELSCMALASPSMHASTPELYIKLEASVRFLQHCSLKVSYITCYFKKLHNITYYL